MNSKLLVLVGAVGLAATGCYASVDPQPVGYAEVTAAPVDIETYPSVVYEGHPTYFYGNRWYYRDGARWTTYQTEPQELQRQRTYVQSAPRARRAPPARVEEREPERGRSEAPAAERIR